MLVGHTYNPMTIHYSPDGTRLISAGSDSLVIQWDAQTGARLSTFTGHDGEMVFAFFLSSSRVLSGDRDGNLLVWNPDSMKIINANHDYQSEVRGMDVAPWNSEIATGAGYVNRTWNEADGTLNQASPIGREFAETVAYVDQDRILVGGIYHVYLKNPNTGELLRTYNIDTLASSLDVSPDGQTFLVAGPYTNDPELWRISGSKVRNVSGNTARVDDAVFSPDGAWIATGADDGSVNVWDATSGLAVKKLSLTQNAWDIEFSPDNQYLAALGPNSPLTICKTSDWSIVMQYMPGSPDHLAFSPDSQKIALAYEVYSDGKSTFLVELLDIETHDVDKQYNGHTGTIKALNFSADGTRLYSAGNDGLVLAWPTGASHSRLHDKLLIVNSADPARDPAIAAQTLALSENVYWVARLRGFETENIRFLSTQDAVTTGVVVSGAPGMDAIASALGTGSDDASRLYIWLMGPGIVDGPEAGLVLGGGATPATLTPASLAALLDAQQEGSEPLREVILIVDCDGAGAFVKGCAHASTGTRRLVMAATQADGVANFGEDVFMSEGVSFTSLILPELMNGHTFHVAFEKADKNLGLLNWPIDHPQQPLFDDDGDGQFTAFDGAVARSTVFGNRPPLNIDLLDGAKTHDKELTIDETSPSSLSVEVPLPEGVEPADVLACLTPVDPNAPDQSIRRVSLEPQTTRLLTSTSGATVSQLYQVGVGASATLPPGKYQVYFSITRTDGYGVSLTNSANLLETSTPVRKWQTYK